MASDSASQEDHFQKKIVQNGPSLQKYFIYFWQKKWSFVVCCLLFVVCCLLLLLFVATLSDFGLLFFKIEALIELRKMLLSSKEKIIRCMVWELLNP